MPTSAFGFPKKIYIYFFLFLLFNISKIHAFNKPSQRGDGMGFIENKGQVIDMNNQVRADILYVGDGAGTKVYLRRGGLSYVIVKFDGADENEIRSGANSTLTNSNNPIFPKDKYEDFKTLTFQRVDIDFENSNFDAKIIRDDRVEGYFNYYLGHCKQGITNVYSYNKIVFQNLYNNIDVAFYGNKQDGLKYDIIVKPGGDPNEIKMDYSGADELSVSEGKLIIRTSLGSLVEYMPKVYQNINGKIVDVKAEYVLNGATLNFKLGIFSSVFPLIIDPWITYYGGADIDYHGGITADHNGNCLTTGTTKSINFPVNPGAFQTLINPGGYKVDAFVAKLDADGNRVWTTFFGGNNSENGNGIGVDKNNNVLVTGNTGSDDFPVTTGSFQTALNGAVIPGYPRVDAFVAKFDPNGNRMWATYYGGSLWDWGHDITADRNGKIVMSGHTNSTDLPYSLGAFQTALGDIGPGGQDGFFVGFDPGGTRLWATYYGGKSSEYAYTIAMDANDNFIASGTTSSTDFPVTPGAIQTALNGSGDLFILKFDMNGNRIWSTFYGGNDFEAGGDLVIDSKNNIVLVGVTTSTIFPVSPGCNQSVLAGSYDFFISKFNPACNPLWATFQGGPLQEGYGYVAVDSHDNIYLIGEIEDVPTASYQTYSCGYQKNYAGGMEDQIITKYDSTGSLLCNTFLGGSKEDEMDYGGGIVGFGESIYFTFLTKGGFPVTPNAFQQNYAGGTSDTWDPIIGKICGYDCGSKNTQTNFTFTQENNTCNVSAKVNSETHACETKETTWQWVLEGATTPFVLGPDPGEISYKENGIYTIALILKTPCSADTVSKTITVNITKAELCCEYFVPNAFSPNGDGNNDIVYAYNQCKKKFDLIIFNRWGQQVFHTNDISVGWNGTFNGQEANTGVYAYVIYEDNKEVRSGNIILLK